MLTHQQIFLPLAADRAPFSQSLIADDRRTFQTSAELLGGPSDRQGTTGVARRADRREQLEQWRARPS
jgi:hypothetical protein